MFPTVYRVYLVYQKYISDINPSDPSAGFNYGLRFGVNEQIQYIADHVDRTAALEKDFPLKVQSLTDSLSVLGVFASIGASSVAFSASLTPVTGYACDPISQTTCFARVSGAPCASAAQCRSASCSGGVCGGDYDLPSPTLYIYGFSDTVMTRTQLSYFETGLPSIMELAELGVPSVKATLFYASSRKQFHGYGYAFGFATPVGVNASSVWTRLGDSMFRNLFNYHTIESHGGVAITTRYTLRLDHYPLACYASAPAGTVLTPITCGEGCPGCELGDACAFDADCASFSCSAAGRCDAPTADGNGTLKRTLYIPAALLVLATLLTA
jgi:hypothetical protein